MIHTSVYQLVNPTMMVESEMKELKGSLKETSNLSYALLVIIIFTKVLMSNWCRRTEKKMEVLLGG